MENDGPTCTCMSRKSFYQFTIIYLYNMYVMITSRGRCIFSISRKWNCISWSCSGRKLSTKSCLVLNEFIWNGSKIRLEHLTRISIIAISSKTSISRKFWLLEIHGSEKISISTKTRLLEKLDFSKKTISRKTRFLDNSISRKTRFLEKLDFSKNTLSRKSQFLENFYFIALL